VRAQVSPARSHLAFLDSLARLWADHGSLRAGMALASGRAARLLLLLGLGLAKALLPPGLCLSVNTPWGGDSGRLISPSQHRFSSVRARGVGDDWVEAIRRQAQQERNAAAPRLRPSSPASRPSEHDKQVMHDLYLRPGNSSIRI
jgi:hypothetical protein